MPIIIDTGALLRPLFTADQFAATQWETAQGKADFGNQLCKFIAVDFKQSLFTKALYGRLSNSCGPIRRRFTRAARMLPSRRRTCGARSPFRPCRRNRVLTT